MEKEKIKAFIIEYFNQNKKVPTIQEIQQATGYTSQIIIKNLRLLIKEGILFFTGNNNYFLNPALLQENKNKEIKQIPVFIEKVNKIKIKNLKFFVVKTILTLISIGAMVLSIFYTFNWAKLYNNTFVSFLLSTITLGFSVICFETVFFFKEKTLTKTIFACILFILWIITFLFSVSTTIIYLYNKRIETIKQQKTEKLLSDYSGKQLILKIEDKNYLLKQLENKEQEYTITRQKWINEGMETTNKIYNRVKSLEIEINNLRKELKKANEDLSKIIEKQENKVVLSIDNFYEWLGKIINIQPENLEFLISLFPALFIDLIAPLGIALALFFVKEKQDKGRKKKNAK